MSTTKTIPLRESVAQAVGLQASYVLARLEQEHASTGSEWVALPVKRMAEVMAPMGRVSAYKALQGLIEAGLVIAKRGSALGMGSDITVHYRVSADGLESLEAARGV